jgi:tetratricopeptide (TPR) repeat protein
MTTPIRVRVFVVLAGLWGAMALGPVAAAPIQDDAVRAAALFEAGNLVAACPMYEALAIREPTSAVIAERLAFCLAAQYESLPAGTEREALIERARSEVSRAKILGDKSNMLRILEERVNSDTASLASNSSDRLKEAEAAFMRGDLDSALAGYEAVAADDPRSYEARLFAGDVLFRKGDVNVAGEWFQKAIDLNPNVETAYRYWGDAIAKSGDDAAALSYYINAVVAEPYGRTSWTGLQQWVKRNGATLRAPHLPAPTIEMGPKDAKSAKEAGIHIGVNADTLADKQAGAAWMAYAANRSVWIKGKYLEANPTDKGYRHSLTEETESLRHALTFLGADEAHPEGVHASIRELVQLAHDDLIEAYVLLNATDEGIAQDYEAYRNGHREQLARYVDQYLIRRGTAIE